MRCLGSVSSGSWNGRWLRIYGGRRVYLADRGRRSVPKSKAATPFTSIRDICVAQHTEHTYVMAFSSMVTILPGMQSPSELFPRPIGRYCSKRRGS